MHFVTAVADNHYSLLYFHRLVQCQCLNLIVRVLTYVFSWLLVANFLCDLCNMNKKDSSSIKFCPYCQMPLHLLKIKGVNMHFYSCFNRRKPKQGNIWITHANLILFVFAFHSVILRKTLMNDECFCSLIKMLNS